MKGQMEQALVQLITSATEAKTFLLSEIPEVIKQLLLWKFVSSLIWTGIGFIIFIALCFYTRFMYKIWKIENDDEIKVAIVFVSLIIYAAAGTPAFLWLFNLDWLQIWLAPKLYLVVYAAKLIN